jgi:hypothetical protein
MLEAEKRHHGGLARQQTAHRNRVPLLIILLGCAVISVLAVVIATLTQGKNRATARMGDSNERSSTTGQRDYPSASLPGSLNARSSTTSTTEKETEPLGPASRDIRPEEQARRQLRAVLDELERSGPARGSLTSDALRTVDDLKRLPALAGADFTEFRCFGDGCAVSITSGSPTGGGDAIISSHQFLLWPGRRFISGPVSLATGQVKTVLVLHTPRHDEISQPVTTR